MTPQGVRKWLIGESTPNIARIASIADELTVDISWLLGSSSSDSEELKSNLSETDARIMNKLRDLTSSQKKIIELMIEELSQ